MKTYILPVVLEATEDAWHVCVPQLEHLGAATWGKSREEALENIQEVLQMVVEEMLEEGVSFPPGVTVADHPAVAVCV